MKKVIYSIYTKIIISILCIFSVLCATTIGLDGLKQWDDYKSEVYLFDSSFEDSHFLSNILNNASYDIYNASVQYVDNNSFNVKENLDNNIDSNHMDYYLTIDGKEFTNAKDNKKDSNYYFHLTVDKEGVIEQEMHPNKWDYYVVAEELKGHNVEIYVGLKDQYVSNIEELWLQQKDLVNGTLTKVTYWLLAVVACLVYLIAVIGKDEEGNIKTQTIDKIFVEFNTLIIAGVLRISFLLVITLINMFIYRDFSYELLKLCMQMIIIVGGSVSLALFLSIIRNIKNKTFVSRCLSFVIFRKIVDTIKSIINEISQVFANYISIMVVGILFVYTTVIGYLGHESYFRPVCVVMGFILFLLVGYFVIKYYNSLNKIKEGVTKIRNGDLNYKIDNLTFKDLNNLKDGINDMSSGLQASVSKTLKAERLKTELITNVSHDLKTPLTSIISYTKLLSDIDNLPEEAKDYVAIIDKKSQRLKALTQDLFDISKVQSGNEEIILERLNVETLLSQSLAEYEKELDNLTVCTRIEEDLHILSDGRKMSRVINNLLINIIKYTMHHTRVFIGAYSKGDKVLIEMKNISSYPLDFDKEEIMQRFRRGDESRTEEGHGLGLAIVKSYVEVTGGKFDIVLDGDMFKAIIEFDKK